jgi:hypothetical protein
MEVGEMKNQTLEQVKQAIRQPFAWPGGYPVYTVMADGELMCPACARNNYKLIAESTRDRDRGDWQAAGVYILWEGSGTCANCYKVLESAYGGDNYDI